MENRAPDEKELLRKWRTSRSEEEQRQILERILTPYIGRIGRWALRIRGNPDDAAEAAQDALLAICSHLGEFRGECRFSTWVYTIVRNQVWKKSSRVARRGETSLEEVAEPQGEESSDPESIFRKRESTDQLRKWIDSELTSLEARIFLLHFGEGIPLQVLNRQLGLTNRSGARAYLLAAKRKLRRRIKSSRNLRESFGRHGFFHRFARAKGAKNG